MASSLFISVAIIAVGVGVFACRLLKLYMGGKLRG